MENGSKPIIAQNEGGVESARNCLIHKGLQQDKQFRNQRGGDISKGVLVAISIPIFTAQLEKSREATDAANVRAAYAEAAAKQIDGTISSTATVVTIKATDTIVNDKSVFTYRSTGFSVDHWA